MRSSLARGEVDVCDVGCLEHSGPEACKLMAVVDLDDVELLHNAGVKAHFLALELRENRLAQVDRHQRKQFLLSLEVALILLQRRLDFVHIARTLEESVHRLFARRQVLNVGLGAFDLFLDRFDGGLRAFELVDSEAERAQIVDLTLDPVVQIGEGVPDVFHGVLQALDQVALLMVVHN